MALRFAETKTVTPVLETGALSDDDSIIDITEITNFMRREGGRAILESVTVIDKDDKGLELEIWLFDATATIPAKNAAWTLADAELDKVLAVIPIATADYFDAAAGQIAHASMAEMGQVLKSVAGSRSLFMALVTRAGAGVTYTASGLVFRFGIQR